MKMTMMITMRMITRTSLTIPVTMMNNQKISLRVSVKTMQVLHMMAKAMMQMEATLLSRIEAILGMMATTRVKKILVKGV